MTLDKKTILESIEKIMPIVDDMGKDRFNQYMKVYLEANNMESSDLFL